jgi:hypothetical protein
LDPRAPGPPALGRLDGQGSSCSPQERSTDPDRVHDPGQYFAFCRTSMPSSIDDREHGAARERA